MPPFEKDEDMILWLMGKGRQREIELREMRECAKRVEVKRLQEESLQRRKYWKGRLESFWHTLFQIGRGIWYNMRSKSNRG